MKHHKVFYLLYYAPWYEAGACVFGDERSGSVKCPWDFWTS